MIRLLIAFLTFYTILIAAEEGDINKKISSTNSKINTFSKNYTTLNKKLSKNAKAILTQRLEIQKQQKFLKDLKLKLTEKELSYKDNKSQLKNLSKYNEKLKKEQDAIEQELVFVIAQSVSLSVILEDEYAVDETSLMEFEILNEMLKASKEKAQKLNEKYYSNSKDIKSLTKQAESLKVAIGNIDSKRKKLISTQNKNKKSLKKLEVAKSDY
ncbi:peptidase M23, partial [Sulfurimonas sp.]|nr:peptidase M23 [Sulfurimonas sp.]